ncbi:MAG: hypothetical protein IJW21_00470 [Clostridia bacterium]|nr:hypothetical protein [Clostridia bacterium]
MKKALLLILALSVAVCACSCNMSAYMAANIGTSYGTDAAGNTVLVEILYDPIDESKIAYEKYHTPEGLPDYALNYNEGKISFIEYYDKTGTYRERVVTYREDGTVDTEEFKKGNVRISSSTVDASGNLLYKYTFYESGKQKSYTEYGAEGKIVRESEFSESGEVLKEFFATYDENGVFYETDVFKNGVRFSVETKKFDASGNFIEHRYDELDANGDFTKTIIYDENGNILN